ncbi:MAG: M13 family metallopeptidase [Lysobacteraceae bacterium]
MHTRHGRPLLACLIAALFLPATSLAGALDPADRDSATPACTDFYQHANGGWLQRHPVPANRGSISRFDQLTELSLMRQRELLDGMDPASADPTERMLATFWRAGLDEAAIETRGYATLSGVLRRIDGIRRSRDVADTVAALHAQGLPLVFNFGADIDLADFGRTIAYLTQGGLGLPDPDFYRRDDAETRALLGRYRAHIERMLALTGVEQAQLSERSAQVLDVEMRLARASLGLVELRDPYNSYQPTPLRDLERGHRNLRLREFMRAQGLRDLESVSLKHEQFFRSLDGMVAQLPVETWQAYLRFHATQALAPHLGEHFRAAHFEFNGRLLEGRAEQPPRWRQVLETMDRTVGDAIGRVYVARHLDDASRERAEAVVLAVRDRLAEGLQQASWLGTEARAAAAEKMATLRVEVGVPRHWHDYSGLQLDAGAGYTAHVLAAAAFLHGKELARVGDTVELRWPVPTQLPDIGYDLALNRLTVTAAMLQPPVLSADGDAAVDFGALGALAGQQLTHGFDDKGRTIDGTGQFNSWWSEADRNGFRQRVQPLEAQYDRFNALDGVMVSGRITLEGNIADLSGVELAWGAFTAAGHDRGGEVDGLDPAQRFFHAWARAWQRNTSNDELRLRLASDTQSPARFRVNGPLMHQAAFATAFGCAAGSPMVRAEDERIRIWQ